MASSTLLLSSGKSLSIIICTKFSLGRILVGFSWRHFLRYSMAAGPEDGRTERAPESEYRRMLVPLNSLSLFSSRRRNSWTSNWSSGHPILCMSMASFGESSSENPQRQQKMGMVSARLPLFVFSATSGEDRSTAWEAQDLHRWEGYRLLGFDGLLRTVKMRPGIMPPVGIEPTHFRLKGDCSAAELRRQKYRKRNERGVTLYKVEIRNTCAVGSGISSGFE